MNIKDGTIYSELPDGIKISNNKFGKCLIATKHFAKGQIVYNGCMILQQEETVMESYNLVITNVVNDKNYKDLKLNKYVHFVKIGEFRQIYGFDGYMNHSCDPTIICENQSDTKYNVIAYKNINKGDEITCDYALFDYECNGHVIEVCGCGSSKCRGSIRGFKNLDIEMQLNLLPLVDGDIYNLFLVDNNLLSCGNISCPDFIEICKDLNSDVYSLKSKKSFEKGDIVYENDFIICDHNQHTLFFLNGKFNISHSDLFIIRPTNKEFLFFDSFMNHSCDPNTKINYISPTSYQMIAIKTILPNDELTCDYNQLDNNYTGEISIPTLEFDCQCKSINCRKKIIS